MIRAGVDMVFGPHSTLSAASSKAKLHGTPLGTIMKTAGCSNARVFATFYKKNYQKGENNTTCNPPWEVIQTLEGIN